MKKRYYILLVLATALGIATQGQNHFTERDTIDVLHYNINLDLGHHQQAHMQGWCEVTMRILQPTSMVQLGLMEATIDSVEVNGSRVANTAYSYNQEAVRVAVGNAAAGDTVRLKVHYGSNGYVGSDGGFWCEDDMFYNLGEDRMTRPFSMGRSWFPSNDSVYDRATFDFHITVPSGWTAVCSGLKTGVDTNADNSQTFHYALSHPISTYQAGCNAARYTLYNTEVEGLYNNYPMQVASVTRNSSEMAADFYIMSQTLKLFEQYFGPYMWETIGFSEGGPRAGMEHVNNICFDYDSYNISYLIDHEFAHQWFGNLVTCAHLQDMWFNEGGATFADQLAGTNRNENNYQIRDYKRVAMVESPRREGGYHPLCGMPQQYSFQTTTYYKGAQVFHGLRHLLGDSVFFSMIQTLLQRNAYTCMDSYQLRDSMSAYSGVDLTDFYNFHIFGPGFSSYTVDSLQTHDGITHVWLNQRLWHAPDYCRQARVPVTFFSESGDTMTCNVVSNGRYADAEFRLPFTPAFATVDYYYKTASANFSETFTLRGTMKLPSYEIQMIVEPTIISNRVNMHTSLAFGTADEELMPGIKRWDYRRWTVNGDYGNNFKAKVGFMFGNRAPIYDNEFYLDASTTDSIRLFYRKDASEPWKMRKSATVQQYTNTITGVQCKYMQIEGTPLRGEYILAVVDTALLDIEDREQEAAVRNPRLSVSPNPASDHAVIAFNPQEATPSQCRITVMNATGKRVAEMCPTGSSVILPTKEWPAGIYFVTLSNPKGSTTKKLIVQ